MTFTKKKILKLTAIVVVAGLLIGGGIVFYLFNMPHRDVQGTNTDYRLSTTQLVSEYLAESHAANEKYLAADGESKVMEVSGTVAKISENIDGQKVVLLKEPTDDAGTNCIFLTETSPHAEKLKVGSIATIKGVIRSGASYDDDLELYENIILDKCDVVNN